MFLLGNVNITPKKKESGAYKGENAAPSKITNIQRAIICKRRAAGEAYSSISIDYPIGLTGIRAVVKDWGPLNGYPFIRQVATKSKYLKLSDKDRKAICKRRNKGETLASITEDYPVGMTSILTVLSSWGPLNGYPYVRKRPIK